MVLLLVLTLALPLVLLARRIVLPVPVLLPSPLLCFFTSLPSHRPAGKKLEPLEEVVCEVEDVHAGEVIEAVTLRKGEVRAGWGRRGGWGSRASTE